jgi:signal-transduction protein with cAMP-binding, CBS, and nucleotidyltransferase domain
MHNISTHLACPITESDYLSRKAEEVAETNLVVLDESTTVGYAAKVMKSNAVSSVLVSRDGSKQPIGIVTERDMLYRVLADNVGPFKATLGEVMSSPLVTVDGTTSVLDAVVLMRKKGIRRLPVTKEGAIVGILTLRSVVGNSSAKNIELADVELPEKITEIKILCPYCQSRFDNKQDLSKHIDRLHLGSGLLEGDLRQW